MMLFENQKRRMHVRGSEMTRGARFVGHTPVAASRPVPVEPKVETGRRFRAGPRWATSAAMIPVLVFLTSVTWTPTVLANPSQDEVFKSISSNVDSHSGNGPMLAILALAAGVILVAAIWKNWSAGPARTNASLNHPGKLIRELMKSTGLKHGQLRQLRVLSDDLEARGVQVQSPLTLLLCPSLLRKAKETDGGKKR